MAVSVHWFRKDLRLTDNISLREALLGASCVYPVYVIEPRDVNPATASAQRVQFLFACLTDLDASLRRLGTRLLCVRGVAVSVLPPLIIGLKATRLTYEKDAEPASIDSAAAVASAVRDTGVSVCGVHGRTLWDFDELLPRCPGRKPPATFQAFCKLVGTMAPPPLALPPPTSWPPGSTPDAPLVLPSLAELGYGVEVPKGLQASAEAFPGGEAEALRRLAATVMERPSWVARFNKPETAAAALEPSTTALSPYLALGCLSPRTFYAAVREAYARAAVSGGHTLPPVSLEGQLLWREFFHSSAAGTPGYDRMETNNLCRRISWDTTPAFLEAWGAGATGYPWIDAIMAQLREQGWIHHLARHAVACFLTRGDLYQSWEAGAAVFDRLLLDRDWALNNGNWLWLSASAYFHRFARVYSPVAFGKKHDPEGAYIRRWLPLFATFPSKYIHEPWKAPAVVQRAHGIVVGETYPARIVVHEDVVKLNIARHTAAYRSARESVRVTSDGTHDAADTSEDSDCDVPVVETGTATTGKRRRD